MDMKIMPCTKGAGEYGYLCHPVCSNLPDAGKRHPDWRKIRCPVCGRECWESEGHRIIKAQDPGIKTACTACALGKGMGR